MVYFGLETGIAQTDVSWLNFIFTVQPTLSSKQFLLLLPWGKMRILRILPSKNNSNGSSVEATVNLNQRNV
jgi:hypothetical protein